MTKIKTTTPNKKYLETDQSQHVEDKQDLLLKCTKFSYLVEAKNA